MDLQARSPRTHVAGFYKPTTKGRLVGRFHQQGQGDRHGPVLRRMQQYPRRLQGHHGPREQRSAREARLALPKITIGDMVHAQKALADNLGIRHLYCVIGGSMGGFRR